MENEPPDAMANGDDEDIETLVCDHVQKRSQQRQKSPRVGEGLEQESQPGRGAAPVGDRIAAGHEGGTEMTHPTADAGNGRKRRGRR